MRLVGLPLETNGIQTKTIEEQKNRQNAVMLYTIPSFHNPTGILMSDERRRILMDVCERVQLPIIEDEL